MRVGRITGCLAALAIAGAGAGCAAPQATTSGAESLESASAVQPSTMPSTVPLSGSPSADPELSAVSPTVQAGQATAIGSPAIPAAPGTAGSNVKPVDSAPVVTVGPGAVTTPLPDCTPNTLRTNSPGKLTFTTGSLRAPWFSGASAADGDGYEAAVARAVASTLGYPESAVEWTTDEPARVLAGTAGGYDVAVSQFVTPDATSATVDFSTGYFPIAQAVVARAGSPAATVTDLAGLKSIKLGAVQRSQVTSAMATAGSALPRCRLNPPTHPGWQLCAADRSTPQLSICRPRRRPATVWWCWVNSRADLRSPASSAWSCTRHPRSPAACRQPSIC